MFNDMQSKMWELYAEQDVGIIVKRVYPVDIQHKFNSHMINLGRTRLYACTLLCVGVLR